MVSKLSWIFFVPFTAAAVFLSLAKTVLPEGAVFGLSDLMLDYAVIGCALAVFLFTLIFCLFDRRISPYYLPHRNIPAGVFGLLLAVVCAADGANGVYHLFSSGAVEVLPLIESVLLMLTSVVFIVLGLTHSFRGHDNRHMSLVNVIPALLFAMRLVICFVSFTTISITLADVTLLFCYIFATLFFFNYAVAISLTEADHAVKSCFIYGFPAVTMMIAYGVGKALTEFSVTDIFSDALMAELLLAALYIVSFLTEMTIFIKDRDHVIIDGDDGEYRELKEEDINPGEDFVVTGLDDDERPDSAVSDYFAATGTEGFIYHDQTEEDKTPVSSYYGTSDPADYITESSASPYDHKRSDKKNSERPDRLDEIDKLILEISGDIE